MKTALAAAALAVALALPAGAQAEDWHPFSRSDQTIYLADVDSVVANGDVKTIRVAKVPRRPTPDQSGYRVELFEFRCAANEVRNVATLEYDASGGEIDRFDDDLAEWEEIYPNSYLEFLKGMACDGNRATSRTWPSIPAFIEAGRS